MYSQSISHHPSSYAVIGSGAIGSFIGGKLQSIGCNVSYVARSNYDALKQQGLTLKEDSKVIHLDHINAFKKVEDLPKSDVYFITTKATSNDKLLPEIAQHVPKDSLVVIVQNGIGAEEHAAKHIDENHLFGAASYIKATETQPGYVEQVSQKRLVVAPYKTTALNDTRTRQLFTQMKSDLLESGLPIDSGDTLPTIRWQKCLFNIPTSGMSVVLNKPMNELVEGEYREMLLSSVKELIKVEQANGATFNEDEALNTITVTADKFKNTDSCFPSMALDIKAGRPVELDALFIAPFKQAQALHIATPLLDQQIQSLQKLLA